MQHRVVRFLFVQGGCSFIVKTSSCIQRKKMQSGKLHVLCPVWQLRDGGCRHSYENQLFQENIFPRFFFFIVFFFFNFYLQGRETEANREKLSNGSVPKWQQQLELSQARNLELNLMCGQGPNYLSHCCCISRCTLAGSWNQHRAWVRTQEL